jgi:spore coat polysaccharide biosynthesis predicted glycosyltransferase SpsG
MPVAVNVLTDVTDMASLMADADAAIGGAGTSSWERCAMGLPTLLVVLADNQKMIAASLEATGAAAILDTTDDARLPGRLTDALAAFGEELPESAANVVLG